VPLGTRAGFFFVLETKHALAFGSLETKENPKKKRLLLLLQSAKERKNNTGRREAKTPRLCAAL
jgi:hypothetical protein